MDPLSYNADNWTEEQRHCLDNRLCMKCKTKMVIKDRINMGSFFGTVDSWGCPNKECK